MKKKEKEYIVKKGVIMEKPHNGLVKATLISFIIDVILYVALLMVMATILKINKNHDESLKSAFFASLATPTLIAIDCILGLINVLLVFNYAVKLKMKEARNKDRFLFTFFMAYLVLLICTNFVFWLTL